MLPLPFVLAVVTAAFVLGAPPTRADCLEQLDAAVLIAREGDPVAAGRQLERLRAPCSHLPQIHHNLGVIAQRGGDTAAAIAHFETALGVDPGTAATVQALRELHRRDAAAAYARALGTSVSAPSRNPPALAWQDAADTRLPARKVADAALYSHATLDYELYDWWTSAHVDTADAWLEHYSDDYPATLALAQHGRPRAVSWESVERELAFTAQDAVAIIEYGAEKTRQRRLLLLRLQGNRWTIYQETPL